MTAVTSVRLRLYASAKAAAGVAEWSADLAGIPTIETALATLPRVTDAPLDRVLARCSFLVNAESTTDRATVLHDGDLVDVLPPFAGG